MATVNLMDEIESASSRFGPIAIRHFDDLPLEIIRRVVTAGSCENALALSSVNRKLRSVCYEPLLFRKIVENGNGSPNFESTEWWSRASSDIHMETSLAAKWALADAKAIAAMSDTSSFRGRDKRTLDWLVPLLVIGHPASPKLVQRFFQLLQIRHDSLAERTAMAAFFFAYQMSQSGILTAFAHPALVSEFSLASHFKMMAPFFPAPARLSKSPLLYPLIFGPLHMDRITGRDHWLNVHLRAMATIGLVASLLRMVQVGVRGSAVAIGPVGRIPTLAPPKPTAIPFARMMRCPAPYSQASSEAFTACYVDCIARRDFLEDGEWVGIYCYSMQGRDDRPPLFDPEMEGIRFRAVYQNANNILELSARGRDGCGGFSLNGRVSSTTGLVLMDKVYDGGSPRWNWSAALTPYGMVGTWGRPNFGGWFWLWKRAWSKSAI